MKKVPDTSSTKASLRKHLGTTSMVAAAALAGTGAAVTTAQAAPPGVVSHAPASAMMAEKISEVHMRGTVQAAEAEAARARGSDPARAAIIQAAINQAKQRPGFNSNQAISISFKLKWGRPMTGEMEKQY